MKLKFVFNSADVKNPETLIFIIGISFICFITLFFQTEKIRSEEDRRDKKKKENNLF
jgi:hypothetical protein